MRNRIFGLIGVLWGGAIVLFKLFGKPLSAEAGTPYATGLTVGFLMGVLMFIVGAYYLFKKPSPK